MQLSCSLCMASDFTICLIHTSTCATAGQLWPRVNHAVSTMGRQQLDPLMKESKPNWISSVQLDRQARATACHSAKHSRAAHSLDGRRVLLVQRCHTCFANIICYVCSMTTMHMSCFMTSCADMANGFCKACVTALCVAVSGVREEHSYKLHFGLCIFTGQRQGVSAEGGLQAPRKGVGGAMGLSFCCVQIASAGHSCDILLY